MNKEGDFLFEFFKQIFVLLMQRWQSPYPVAYLPRINQNKIIFIVAAQNELTEKFYFLLVLSLSLHFIIPGSA